MADFNITISNSVNVFGVEISTKWGQTEFPYTMTWGTSLWGYGYTTVLDVEKVIDNSVTPGTTIINEVTKLISESITPAFETSSEGLKNGAWNYVFTNNTTEAEERDTTTWNSASVASVSYTSLTATSVTWT